MKRPILMAATFLVLLLCKVNLAHAGHPGYGVHDYGWGRSELVLEQDLAYELASNLYRSPTDPVSQGVIRNIVERSKAWGGRLVSRASLASMFLSGAMWATQQQMKYTASVKNYEAYGFKMQWGQPYWCVTYSYDEGALLKEKSSPHVFVVFGNAKYYVPNAAYFNHNWGRVRTVPNGRLGGWFPYPDAGTLLRESSKPAVWMVVWGPKDPRYTLVSPSTQWGWVRRQLSAQSFARLGLSWSKVRVVPDGSFDAGFNKTYLPRGYDLL